MSSHSSPTARPAVSPGAGERTSSAAPTDPSASTANGGAEPPRRKRCATISRWRMRKAPASGSIVGAMRWTAGPATSAGGFKARSDDLRRAPDRHPFQLPPRRLERGGAVRRSEEHTSELQSLMRISYAVFCLKKKKQHEQKRKKATIQQQ